MRVDPEIDPEDDLICFYVSFANLGHYTDCLQAFCLHVSPLRQNVYISSLEIIHISKVNGKTSNQVRRRNSQRGLCCGLEFRSRGTDGKFPEELLIWSEGDGGVVGGWLYKINRL